MYLFSKLHNHITNTCAILEICPHVQKYLPCAQIHKPEGWCSKPRPCSHCCYTSILNIESSYFNIIQYIYLLADTFQGAFCARLGTFRETTEKWNLIRFLGFFTQTKRPMKIQREKGDNGLFITQVPKVLQERFLISWFNNFGDFKSILNGWIRYYVQCSNISTINCYLERIILCKYNHCGCTSIYRSLSYPFRSQIKIFLVNILKWFK